MDNVYIAMKIAFTMAFLSVCFIKLLHYCKFEPNEFFMDVLRYSFVSGIAIGAVSVVWWVWLL